MKKIIVVSFACLLVSLAAGKAQAAEPRLMGSYGQWSAYAFTEGGKKVCYMASKPAGMKGDYKTRGDVYALLTHRPSEGTRDVFSYITGYTFKTGSEVTIEIDDQSFTLFTQDDTAWTADAETDGRISQAIRQGSKMTVKGTSARGTMTTDSFDLAGSTRAHERITQECN